MPEPLRKIVHIDMDAFYASVEQRDNPRCAAARGRGLDRTALGGLRGLVRGAALRRAFGHVGGARAALSAGGHVPPDFNRYREVSRQVRQIYARHTDPEIEPLSLDEAYLDVTVNRAGCRPPPRSRRSSATRSARKPG